jgi:hypothetical protein
MFINLNSFQEYGIFQELQYTLTDVSTKHEYETAKENNLFANLSNLVMVMQ